MDIMELLESRHEPLTLESSPSVRIGASGRVLAPGEGHDRGGVEGELGLITAGNQLCEPVSWRFLQGQEPGMSMPVEIFCTADTDVGSHHEQTYSFVESSVPAQLSRGLADFCSDLLLSNRPEITHQKLCE
jgi:hypothetical protein